MCRRTTHHRGIQALYIPILSHDRVQGTTWGYLLDWSHECQDPLLASRGFHQRHRAGSTRHWLWGLMVDRSMPSSVIFSQPRILRMVALAEDCYARGAGLPPLFRYRETELTFCLVYCMGYLHVYVWMFVIGLCLVKVLTRCGSLAEDYTNHSAPGSRRVTPLCGALGLTIRDRQVGAPPDQQGFKQSFGGTARQRGDDLRRGSASN